MLCVISRVSMCVCVLVIRFDIVICVLSDRWEFLDSSIDVNKTRLSTNNEIKPSGRGTVE